MKDGAIRLDSKIDPENPKIKDAAVIDKCNDADNGRNKQQGIKTEVHQCSAAARKRPNTFQDGRRPVSAAPPESCHQSEPQQQSKNRVDVDPKPLRLLGPRVVQ